MRKNKGISIISFILEIIIIAILAGVAYMFYEYLITDSQENNLENETASTTPITITNIQENQTTNIETSKKAENPLNQINSGQTQTTTSQTETQTRYYYNQLDSNAKIIYDALIDNKEKLKTGTYEINFGTKFDTLIKSTNGSSKINTAFQSALDAFEYENPQIFYLDISKMYLNITTTTKGNNVTHTVTLGKGKNANYLNGYFTSKEQIEQAEADMESIRANLISKLSGDTTNKIKQIHDCLVGNFEYLETQYNCRNIYGALIERKVVCEGYAKTFKYFLDGIGIENIIVVGTATNSDGKTENHAWNYVNLNGKWYGVDVTWDDPIVIGEGKISEQRKYQYLLKGSEVFSKDHTPNGKFTENSIEFTYPEI